MWRRYRCRRPPTREGSPADSRSSRERRSRHRRSPVGPVGPVGRSSVNEGTRPVGRLALRVRGSSTLQSLSPRRTVRAGATRQPGPFRSVVSVWRSPLPTRRPFPLAATGSAIGVGSPIGPIGRSPRTADRRVGALSEAPRRYAGAASGAVPDRVRTSSPPGSTRSRRRSKARTDRARFRRR